MSESWFAGKGDIGTIAPFVEGWMCGSWAVILGDVHCTSKETTRKRNNFPSAIGPAVRKHAVMRRVHR